MTSKFRILGISVPSILKMTDSKDLILDEVNMLSIYGHEGGGHGANFLATEDDTEIPAFSKENIPWQSPTIESVAQHIESIIFDTLKKETDIQKKLEFTKSFSEIYSEYETKDTIKEFKRKRYRFEIYTLTKDMPLEKKIEKINEVSLNPLEGWIAVSKLTYEGGKLNPQVVRDLIYAAEPVNDSLELISKSLGNNFYEKNSAELNKFLLTGHWTPTGFIERTKLFIEENK